MRCESASAISEHAGGNENARFRIAPFTATARRGSETYTRVLCGRAAQFTSAID